MSGNDGAKSGWTDKERLTYLFALIDNSNVKFDYNNTPRPTGRSVIACQRMMERLKGTLKNELEALMSSDQGTNDNNTTGTPKKKTPTPRKRKAKGDAEEGEANVKTPAKRGRKKKEAEKELTDEEIGGGDFDDETITVKPEFTEDEV